MTNFFNSTFRKNSNMSYSNKNSGMGFSSKTSGMGYSNKSSFFTPIEKSSTFSDRLGSSRLKNAYGGSSFKSRFPGAAQINDSTIGISFKPVSTNIKEHSNSQLHSIMFSRKLQHNKKSLLFLRCQDYMHMINNTDNCLDALSGEIQKAVNVNHFNSDMITQSNATWRQGQSNSFMNTATRGHSGSPFFSGNQGKMMGSVGRNQSSFFDNRSKRAANLQTRALRPSTLGTIRKWAIRPSSAIGISRAFFHAKRMEKRKIISCRTWADTPGRPSSTKTTPAQWAPTKA